MTFEFGSDSDDELGAEAFVSPNLDGHEDAPLNRAFAISAVPIGIKKAKSLRIALTNVFKRGLGRKKREAQNISVLELYDVAHFSKPEDFVPKTARARMDPPLPEDYKPQDRWNFEKK